MALSADASEVIYKAIVTNSRLSPSEERELSSLLKSRKSLTIVVAGKTGSGKSTLLNGLIGDRIFTEGESLKCQTQYVSPYRFDKFGVRVTVWDCPGLQDGSGKEKKYMQDLVKATNGDFDVLLYCIDMSVKRSDLHDGNSAIHTITRELGEDIWKNTLIVLTFANEVERTLKLKRTDKENLIKKFSDKVTEWKLVVQEELTKLHVSVDIVENITVVPAGYYQPSLPGREYWLTDVWVAMVSTTNTRAQHIPVIFSCHRFQNASRISAIVFQKSSENQPFVIIDGPFEGGDARIGRLSLLLDVLIAPVGAAIVQPNDDIIYNVAAAIIMRLRGL